MFFSKLLLTVISSNIISNDVVIINNKNYNEHLQVNKEEKAVLDFNDVMRRAYEYTEGLKEYSGWKIDRIHDIVISNQKNSDCKAIAVGSPTLVSENKKYNYIGQNILKNYNQQEQIMKAAAFSKTIESQYSTSVTAGVSLESDADFFFFDAKMKISLSGTITNIKKESQTFTIPSQNVKVPARSQVNVTAYWSQVEMKQNVKISADISGTITGICDVTSPDRINHYTWNDTFDLGKVFYSYFGGYKTYWPDCPQSITVNDNDSIHFEGALDVWGSGAGSYHEVDFGPYVPVEN